MASASCTVVPDVREVPLAIAAAPVAPHIALHSAGRCVVATALAALVAACASAPAPGTGDSAPGGLQQLRVLALAQQSVESDPLYMRQGAPLRYEPLEGDSCSLRNDRGAWTVVTPATVNVQLSNGKLAIECSKEGFFTRRGTAPCLSERQRRTMSGASAVAAVASSAAPAIVAAAPPVGLAVAGIAGAVAIGGAIGASTAGPGADTCDYSPTGELHVFMYPRPTGTRPNW